MANQSSKEKNLVNKYLVGKSLSNNEKKDFLKFLVYYEIDVFEDWFEDDLKFKKTVKSAFVEIGGSHNQHTAFIRILKGEYEPIGWIYSDDYKTLFGEEQKSIGYYDFLKNIGITPRKIDDLLVTLDFNLQKDALEDINPEIVNQYKTIPILKSDSFFMAD